jgi:hypothetical protein
MATSTTSARALPGRTGLVAGLLFFVVALAILWARMPAAWPVPLELRYSALAMPKGVQDPIIVTGKTGAADFLFLRHEGDGMARLGYDSWGGTGEYSDLFPLPKAGSLGRLEITMPSLLPEEEDPVSGRTHLRVVVDGRVVIDRPVHHYPHTNSIHFAQNPAGGSSTAESLRGELYQGSWRMDGPVEPPNAGSNRVLWILLSRQPGRIVTLLALSALFGLGVTGLGRLWSRRAGLYPKPGDWALHGCFLLALLLCLSAFLPLVTYGSGELVKLEDFGIFFDHQAQSILHGRLDVPDRAIGGEAFLVDGKRYGYFGLTPSLLRIPFVLFNVGMEKLSRSFMLGYYCLSLLCVYALTRQAFRVGNPGGRPPGWVVFALTLSAGLGSTLFFLGSRSYIYHEAIFCGVSCALVSMVFTLRWLAEPRRADWAWALLFAVLAMHARPPSGLFALSFIACVAAWFWLREAWLTRTSTGLLPGLLRLGFTGQRPALIILGTGLGVLSFNAVGYLKFGVFDGCPLRYHVQYMEVPARLARIGNKQFYLENVPFNQDAYLTGRHFLVDRAFPWFHGMNPTDDGNRYSTAHMDIAENTVAMPFSMPAPFWLGTLGIVFCLLAGGALRETAGLLALAVVPVTAALLAAVAVSQRYTGDFVPFLVLASALGLAAVCSWTRRLRPLVALLVFALVLLSAGITAALALNYQGKEVWGVDQAVRDRYVRMQQKADQLLWGGR